MPIDRDLVSASQVDLRRLSLLAALAAAGRRGTDVDPEPAAKEAYSEGGFEDVE